MGRRGWPSQLVRRYRLGRGARRVSHLRRSEDTFRVCSRSFRPGYLMPPLRGWYHDGRFLEGDGEIRSMRVSGLLQLESFVLQLDPR
jgi:hypothetical protein